MLTELDFLYKRAQFRLNKNFGTKQFGESDDTYQMYKPYSVLLTSVPLQELKTACIALGVNEFFNKPIENLQLEKILKENNLIPLSPLLDKDT